jgi:hypothetical protein
MASASTIYVVTDVTPSIVEVMINMGWYNIDAVTTLTFQTCPSGHLNCQNASLGWTSVSGGISLTKQNISTIGSIKKDYVSAQSHTHDVNIGTVTSASGAGSHSHDVTIDAHTHDIDFGIYEEDITGRTLSAKLYDPDGNVLKDFGTVLTGEDNDVLDLSEYFENLKYGMYRLVLTASGRLRARLVFYELCKMYAQY